MTALLERAPAAGGTASYWQAQHGPYAPATTLLPATAGVVVVGAGIIGMATAYWLARRGAGPLVLEADDVGAGATGRNAGLVLSGRSPLEDLGLLRAVLEEEAIDAAYEEHGHLALASSPNVLAAFETEVAARPSGAPTLEALGRDACEELLGLELAPGFAGGRWLPRSATVDPVALVRGLADAAVRHGAVVVSGARVDHIDERRGGVTVATGRGAVEAGAAVVACGATSARMLPLGDVLVARRAQMLATEPVPRTFELGLAVDWGSAYWRQTRDGTIVLGGCGHVDPNGESTGRDAVNPRVQAALDAFLPSVFPGLSAPAVAQRWSGIMDLTPDERPLVGQWPGGGNRWVAAGFGGHGLPPALGVGRALADAIDSGRSHEALAPLRPARFAVLVERAAG